MKTKNQKSKPEKTANKGPNVFLLLGEYKKTIIFLVLFALATNVLNLFIPKLIANSIDNYVKGTLVVDKMILIFSIVAFLIFLFLYLQSVLQTYASEIVAKDLRTKLADKISHQDFNYIQTVQPSKILTTLTSDIDSIKTFVSQAIVSMVSSISIIIGVSILLLSIDWRLALVVLTVIPIIGFVFYFIFSKVKTLFTKSREVIDWLNKVINESILGAMTIRVVNAEEEQSRKFIEVNTEAKNVGLSILSLFAALIPIITFVAGLATLAIVVLGGHFVINDTMSLGDFTAFYSYIGLLIFPILMIGFMSSLIAQATVSYTRISEVLNAELGTTKGKIKTQITGDIEVKNLEMTYGEHKVLKNISFSIKAGTKTAIIGPTAGGKSQLLYSLVGLINPTEGKILFDGNEIHDYDEDFFHNQIGFVFQDSSIFNLSIRENIAFNKDVENENLDLAIKTAELSDFVDNLPEKLDTIVSERGTSLSGGQKQRIMLARALAVNPKILFLDDFTARVDTKTENAILGNITKNYPNLTLISVTQKIATIENYDSIIVMMEGEMITQGTHDKLLQESTEYVQIYNSQKSTNSYELHA